MATQFDIRDANGNLLFSIESTGAAVAEPRSTIADLNKAVESAFAECTKYYNAIEVMSIEAGFGDKVGAVAKSLGQKIVAFFKKIIEFCSYVSANVKTKNVMITRFNRAIHETAKKALSTYGSMKEDGELAAESKEMMTAVATARKILNTLIKQDKLSQSEAGQKFAWTNDIWGGSQLNSALSQFGGNGIPDNKMLTALLERMSNEMENFQKTQASEKNNKSSAPAETASQVK